jgi:hypothetical protein
MSEAPEKPRAKKRFGGWMSAATRRKLDALAVVYGTISEALAVAIDRLYQAEIVDREKDEQG